MAYSGPDPFKPRQGGTGAQTLTGIVTGNGTATMTANAVTQYGVLTGGASNAASSTAALTDGQLLVGATSAAPNLLTAWMMQGNNCWFWNLSFTHSAGILTLEGADGTALSATNPGYIVMPSNATQGRLVLHTLIANDTLTVSNLTGNIFGTTASVAWGNSMPLYIGFMADSSDANLEPVICRLPHLGTSPSSSANIGDPSSATADLENSVFAWNNIIEANYQSMKLGSIGSLTATKDASDVWTLDSLTNNDGVGRWNDTRQFFSVEGQNGAETGTFFQKKGTDTEPIYNTQQIAYTISRSGRVDVSMSFNTCSTAGVGTGTLQPTLPLSTSTQQTRTVTGILIDNSASDSHNSLEANLAAPFNYISSIYGANGGTVIFTMNSADLNDQIWFHVNYIASIGS